MAKPTNMHKPMTKAQARAMLGVANDRQLALRLGIKAPSVCNWGRMVPRGRIAEICRLAVGK